MTELIFSTTERFCQAVKLINELDSKRFPKLLSRVAEKLHLRKELAFSEEEQKKLHVSFDLSPGELSLLLETIEFILQQAAYYGLKASKLLQQLTAVNLETEKAEAIASVWSQSGKAIMEKFRKHSIAEKQLESVDWDMNLQLAQKSKTRMKEANAIFHLNLSNADADKKEKILLEFNHEELLQFYNKLEVIQSQLDTLS